MDDKTGTWDEIYKKKGAVQAGASEQVTHLVPVLRDEGVERIIDLGCGTGRHTLYLAQEGFYAVGLDSSAAALREAQAAARGMDNVEFVNSDASQIPYEDGFFDAALSIHIVQHMKERQRKRAISALERTLKEGGLLFLRTISRTHPFYGKGEEIEPHTFINTPRMPDGKMPHHFFSREELESYISNFEILALNSAVHEPKEGDFFGYELHELAVLARKKE